MPSLYEEPDRKTPDPARPAFVYFLVSASTGLIKIGVTDLPRQRIGALRTQNADRLFLLGTIRCERAYERELHRRFAKSRRHGEWFAPSVGLLRFIIANVQIDPEEQLAMFQHGIDRYRAQQKRRRDIHVRERERFLALA